MSAKRSTISFNLHGTLFKKYSLSPDLKTRLVIVTSEYSIGRIPFVFSIVIETSAIPRGFLFFVPLNMTSSILSLLKTLALCSPRTHLIASTMFVFPHPFGPTIAVIPPLNLSSTLLANDLNPNISSRDRYIYPSQIFILHCLEYSPKTLNMQRMKTHNHKKSKPRQAQLKSKPKQQA